MLNANSTPINLRN